MTDIETAKPTHSVQYGERRLAFLWRQRDRNTASGQRKARIHVHPNGLIEVETPTDTSLPEVKKALLKRAQWVSKHLIEIEARRAEVLEREYVSGEAVFYLGRRYTLKVVASDQIEKTKLLNGRLRVTLPSPHPHEVKQAMDHWYRFRAEDVFSRRLAEISDRLPWVKSPPQWAIREMKSQWGSCSPSGRVLLNPNLVKTPTRCIDYVILHELCHLKEHNHSPRFYSLLSRAMPDWETIKERLDSMSELYLNH